MEKQILVLHSLKVEAFTSQEVDNVMPCEMRTPGANDISKVVLVPKHF